MTDAPKKQDVDTPRDTAIETSSGPMFELQPMLEASRTRWQHGEWAALAATPLESIETHPDRAKIALLIGAAKAQLGEINDARTAILRAAAWGCGRELIGRVLTSTLYNSLGRVAASLDDDESATRHFEEAINLVEPRADAPLLARTRRVRETARMGLLPDAAKLLGMDLTAAEADPVDHAARLGSMRTELDLIGYELSLSLRRGQIMAPHAVGSDADTLKARAVSQLGQDLWVLEKTDHKRDGFFVEFGATDGVRLSNTYLLETEFNWRGLCAEPNPALFEQLVRNRRCVTSSACIGPTTGEKVEFILADAFGGIAEYAMSDYHADRRDDFRRDGKTAHFTTISLEDFLIENDAPRTIDYLSIDTEGSEYEILRTFPFDRWAIRLITVEHNHTPMREKLRDLLEPLGYRRTEVEFDDWYALE